MKSRSPSQRPVRDAGSAEGELGRNRGASGGPAAATAVSDGWAVADRVRPAAPPRPCRRGRMPSTAPGSPPRATRLSSIGRSWSSVGRRNVPRSRVSLRSASRTVEASGVTKRSVQPTVALFHDAGPGRQGKGRWSRTRNGVTRRRCLAARAVHAHECAIGKGELDLARPPADEPGRVVGIELGGGPGSDCLGTGRHSRQQHGQQQGPPLQPPDLTCRSRRRARRPQTLSGAGGQGRDGAAGGTSTRSFIRRHCDPGPCSRPPRDGGSRR